MGGMDDKMHAAMMAAYARDRAETLASSGVPRGMGGLDAMLPKGSGVARMAEVNESGQQCDCGSTAKHVRAPGCTPLVDSAGVCPGCGTARSHHIGKCPTTTGVFAVGDTHPAVVGLPGGGASTGLSSDTALSMSSTPPNCSCATYRAQGVVNAYCARCPTKAPTPSSTAILGDARLLIQRARRMLRAVAGTISARDALEHVEDEILRLEAAESARATPATIVPPTTSTCWSTLIGATPHNLGEMPDVCFTCAAKRVEDRAKVRTP